MSEQMREEFKGIIAEAFGMDESEFEIDDCRNYPDRLTDMFYEVWALSRQSLVVKLPAAYTMESAWIDALEVDSNEQYFSVDSVNEALDAAGVGYE